MKEKEFKSWRRVNLSIALVGVILAIVGTVMNFSGHSYGGRWIVIGGAFWYIFFYLRITIVRRWHESDQLNALLDQYHELKGMHHALRTRRDEAVRAGQGHEQQLEALRAQIELAKRRHLRRDIDIATILTRRFVVLTLHVFAVRYRHGLVNPILDMVRDGMIREDTVITHLDEPAAFADVVYARKSELEAICPRLIALCEDHWPPPESEAA